ncbi:MAG: glutamate--tRNA ligase [Gammaproteobacteria bacterium]|nr:glutamate--tRNA ligase [Gammaproteobacteria bacterium]MBU6509089.1 glutamate--tRNA ligase [Gammaproteobacteria bacterium]MDE1983382.1 glutamate--tRNA ligase [Gammaproteobacteria bacterium]MDE2108214.1 glutamate--tRNA ligase [Gammaproteobacteria bacterium]MDE2461557.1 glutamate--tRNA ligase [Gammaproteobacteria bacterium]
MTVRTRFAPSPTGYLHIGGARTALFCWLYARHHHGQFILRIEDTDRERSTPQAVQAILDGMGWLELRPDEGPFYQTQRFDRYSEVAAQLRRTGHAYHCYCSKEELEHMRAEQLARKQKPRYDGRCRERKQSLPGVAPVLRFKNPQTGQSVVNDLVRGKVVFDNAELDDLIILRSDGTPTYNFTVVVDDMDMHISHVIRGDDHLNNTPRQINIFQALGVEPPQYAHLPMILGPDGTKLSKRHGAVSVMQYREDGILPAALLNYLVRLGWSHGDQEIFTREQMIEYFDLGDVNQSASAINPAKLEWLNQQYIKGGDPEVLATELRWHLARVGVETDDEAKLAAVVRAQAERARTLKEMAEHSRFFFQDFADYDPQAAQKNLTVDAQPALTTIREGLAALKDWSAAAVHVLVGEVATAMDVKLGKVAQPLRVSVSGGSISPPIDVTLEILGREVTLARLDRALAWIAAQTR